MRLLLFDIDGTLLHCGSQVRGILGAALEQVFGTAGPIETFPFGGKTDPQILIELLAGTGVTEADVLEALPRVRQTFSALLEERLDREGMRLLPGVGELLEELVEHPRAALGLVTGNWEITGRIKLSRFDLNRYFHFGAFGDDGIDRRRLPLVALERAVPVAGRRVAPQEALIVGDSLNDVACAQANGLPVLAVATGWTPAEELAEAGATWVVKDLTEAREIVLAFLSGTFSSGEPAAAPSPRPGVS